jgi:hypothetical protein
MFSLCGIQYGIHVSNWIDSESRNTAQICDVWIVRIHYKVVRCRCKVEGENTYVLFTPDGNPGLNIVEDTPVDNWRLRYWYFDGTSD